MRSVRRSLVVSLRQSLRRSLTLLLRLLAVTSLFILVTISPAYSQTTTTTPCDPLPTNPTTLSADPQVWATCKTQHDVENLRADVLFGGAILIVLTSAVFVSRLLVGSTKQ